MPFCRLFGRTNSEPVGHPGLRSCPVNAARVASVHPRLSENAHNVVDGNDCASRQRVDGLVQVGFERPVNGDVKRLNFVGGVGRQREQDHVVLRCELHHLIIKAGRVVVQEN